MRVCVGPDMSWLNSVSGRPFPLEDGEKDHLEGVPQGVKDDQPLSEPQRGDLPADQRPA